MLYSDLNSLSPTKRPLLTDVEAVYQSLYTLFNTRKGENLFNPEYGVDLEDYLFESMDDLTSLTVLTSIVESVELFEPRVVINTGDSSVTPYPDENKYELTLVFDIVGIESDQKFTLIGSFSQ